MLAAGLVAGVGGRDGAFAALTLLPVALAVLEIVMWRRGARWLPALLIGAITAVLAFLAVGTTLAVVTAPGVFAAAKPPPLCVPRQRPPW